MKGWKIGIFYFNWVGNYWLSSTKTVVLNVLLQKCCVLPRFNIVLSTSKSKENLWKKGGSSLLGPYRFAILSVILKCYRWSEFYCWSRWQLLFAFSYKWLAVCRGIAMTLTLCILHLFNEFLGIDIQVYPLVVLWNSFFMNSNATYIPADKFNWRQYPLTLK